MMSEESVFSVVYDKSIPYSVLHVVMAKRARTRQNTVTNVKEIVQPDVKVPMEISSNLCK